MTGQATMRVIKAQATEYTCPKCGHKGFCDVSPHVYFVEDRLALRCQACRHVWPDEPIGGPEG